MNSWAARISAADGAALGAIRLLPGAECAELAGIVWLRGPDCGEDWERALTKVAGLERFELLASGRLKPLHSRIPTATLPPATWRPLKEVCLAQFPTAALAADSRQKLTLNLVRSAVEQTPTALLTTLEVWVEFATNAPLIRLEPLSFAVAEDRQTLVRGQPLPALPGLRFIDCSGILTPGGYTWSPEVSIGVLRELFQMGSDDSVILSADGTQQILRAEQFVRASRSAARASLAAFSHD